MLTRYLTFFIFLLSAPIFSFSQSCSDTAKKIYYSAVGHSFNMQQHIVSNDQTFLAGSYDRTGIFMFKISSDGSIGFSKTIQTNLKGSELYCNALLHLKNGNNILAIGYPAFMGSGDTTFKIVMLDGNGNKIWVKEYSDISYRQLAVKNIAETEDGNFIIMLNFFNSEFEDMKTALVRIDNSGNIIWAHYYSLAIDKIAEGVALSILNGNIYIVGLTNDPSNFFMGYPDYAHNLWAAKIEESSGNLLDSKSFFNLRIQYTQGGETFFPNIYANLVKKDSDYFIFTNKYDNSNRSLHGLQKMTMDTNLNFSDPVFYDFNDQTNRTERIMANAKGEVITYAEIASAGNSQTYVSKFNSLNEPIREIQIQSPPGSNAQKPGSKPLGLKDKYISVVNTYDVAGDTHFQLFQLPDDVEISDCYGKDTSVVKQRAYTITEVSHPFFSETKDISMQVNDIAAMVSDLPLVVTEDCEIKSFCDSLSVSGQDTVCSTKKLYTFVAHKNPDCKKHVLWQIDSLAVEIKNQINDTTIQIKFKKDWSGYLYASITSCTVLKDSIKINVLASPDIIDLGSDTILCVGGQLLLNSKQGFKSYKWQNGSTDSTFIVTQPGKYFVTTKDYCDNIYSDTILISYKQPSPINIGNDTSICHNTFLKLNAGDNFLKYKWNNGELTQSIMVNTVGEYSVSATNSYGCISRDTIKILNIFPSPNLALNKQNVLCLKQNNKINAGSGFSSYLWQNRKTDSIIIVTAPGLYKVTVSNNYNCFASDSVTILQVVTAPANFLGADSAICKDDSIVIYPHLNFSEYLWSTGSTNNSIQIKNPGIYWLNVKDKNLCKGSDTIRILPKNCDAVFFIPNAFTPNNDGLNDIFKPIITGNISDYYFAVYNRFGQIIFSTNNPDIGWDGRVKGAFQNSGTFVWLCRYKMKNKVAQSKRGSVLLIR